MNPCPRYAAPAVLLALAGAACAHAEHATAPRHDPVAVRASIEASLHQFSTAMERADAPAVAALFTEDGEYVVPAAKGFITGRAAIQEVFAERFKATRFLQVTITTVSVQVDGDTAYETGTNRVTFQAGEAPPVTRTGRYVTIWRRQSGGAWRIRIDALVPDPQP